MQKSFEFLGIEFVVFVAPNKESIYTDKLPSYYERRSEISSAECLVNYLKEHTDIRLVYPKDVLEKTLADDPSLLLYHKLDTHWNHAGGYIGAVALAKELGLKMPSIHEIVCTPEFSNSGDLAQMLNITIENGDVDYQLDGFSTLVTESEVWDFHTEFIYHTPGADNRNLFVYRDSYSSDLAPYIASQFTNSYFIFLYYFNQQQIFDYAADIFVLETVERYIDQLKTFHIAFASVNIETLNGQKDIVISKSIPEDFDLNYVSIYKINNANQEIESIQATESLSSDIHITVDEQEQGQIVIDVYDDEQGENLINHTVAEY